MSTLKSSSANLTLNADGSGNDIKFQSNASEVGSLTDGGVWAGSTFEPTGDTAAGDNAAIGYTAAEGLILTGQGSTNDVTIKNDADATVLHVATGSTDVVVSNGDLKVDSGDLFFGTSGKGICLGVTSNTDANTLDDYEEGTWTPVWTSEGGTLNTNTTYTRGTYTKVGRQVTIYARFYTNSVSSPTGYITLSGLPFTIEGTNDTQGAYALFRLGAITGTLSGTPVALPMGGTATLKVIDKVWDSTQSSGDIADHLDNDAWAHVRLTYFV